jgi:hypothetical protein
VRASVWGFKSPLAHCISDARVQVRGRSLFDLVFAVAPGLRLPHVNLRSDRWSVAGAGNPGEHDLARAVRVQGPVRRVQGEGALALAPGFHSSPSLYPYLGSRRTSAPDGAKVHADQHEGRPC